MKASEVLARYQKGERDFQGVNLRGQSFRKQDLSGADFSGADIRGTNFRGAILRGTKFCRVRSGLQKRWVFFRKYWWILAPIASAIVSVISDLVVKFNIFDRFELFRQATSQTSPISSFNNLFSLLIGSFLGATLAILWFSAIAETINATKAVLGALLLTVFILVIVIVIRVGNLAATVIGVLNGVFLVTFFIYQTQDSLEKSLDGRHNWRSLNDDPNHTFSRHISSAFVAIGGTTFRNADLTDADFEGANLKNTDFRESDLTRTNFKAVEQLLFVRPGKTILANPAVMELLATRQGEGKDYTDANLRGANLVGANLRGAILKLADLADANLEYANLDGANLAQANAVGTNFRHASLTGACIEAWNIENSTILDEVDCRYIYLLEHPKRKTDDRERRPSSGEFGEGEFTKLFSEVLDTVDLIFRNGVDWKAFVSAFQKVQVKNEDTPLEIQSIENKGNDVVVVKVNVPPNTDKGKIHREFTDSYGLALKAAEEKYKAQLEARDNEITLYRQQNANMMEITKLLAAKPIHVEAKAMSNSNDQSRSFQVGDVGGDFKPIGAPILADNANISGTVAETINQLPASPTPDKPGIKELLEQLKAAIDELPEDDKSQALQQLQTLAEAAADPKNADMQKKAKKAIGFIKVISEGLEPAAKLVAAGKALLPAIAAFFGF